MKKKVQLYGYTRNNVGDDMFIYSFVKLFPNVEFYINIKNKNHTIPFKELKNLNITIQDNEVRTSTLNSIDACVYIAGSIFMERGNAFEHQKKLLSFIVECKEKGIPYYFISSNYGPYITNEYLNVSKEIFKNCADICFRDKYSYNLFSNIDTVRYAPDFLFSYDYKKFLGQTDMNTLGISVIDMDIRPHLIKYEENYIKFLTSNIISFIERGFKLYLISFCEHEGDVVGINKVIDRLPQKYKQIINVIEYKGNIEVFLNEYSKLEYVLCTRFHSMVLSMMLNQKSFCMSYSDKLDNVILDLNLYKDFLKIDKITEQNIIDISEFDKLRKTQGEIISLLSKEQTREFERFIKG